MFGLLRLAVVGLVVLSVVFVALRLYLRSLRRESLENEWDAARPDEPDSRAREEFIHRGMAEYDARLKRRLIWSVYVAPAVLVVVVLLVTNFM